MEKGRWILRTLRQASVDHVPLSESESAELLRSRDALRELAPQEVLEELTALLCGAGVEQILRRYAEVIAVLIPELVPMFGFEQHNPHHDRDVWEHTIAVVAAAPATPVMRWAALLHDVAKPSCFSIQEDGLGHFYGHAHKSQHQAEEILGRFGMAEAEKARIGELIRYHDFPIPPEPKPLMRLVRKHGEETVRQLIELHIADTRGQSALCAGRVAEYRQVEAALEACLEEERKPVFTLAVNGHDLQELGLQGRELGAVLRRCTELVKGGQLPNDRPTLLSWLRDTVQKA